MDHLNQAFEELLSDLAALKQAVDLLGFDPTKLIEAMRLRGDGFWKVFSLLSLDVAFDETTAYELHHCVTAETVSRAKEWIDAVRKASHPTAIRPAGSPPALVAALPSLSKDSHVATG